MGNESEVKVDTSSQAQVNNAEANTALVAPAAQKNVGTEKVSSIIPPKGTLEPLRETTPLLTEGHIHIVHILVFILALYFLFAGMWKFGKKTKF